MTIIQSFQWDSRCTNPRGWIRYSHSHHSLLWSSLYERKPLFQKQRIKINEREGQMRSAQCFLILKASSLIICPKVPWDILVSSPIEWYVHTSDVCFGPGGLRFP